MQKPKVSVFIGISIDGFMADENRDISWLSIVERDPPEDNGYKQLIEETDVLVMGRNTYDMILSSDEWPYSGKSVFVLTHHEQESLYGEQFYNGKLTELLDFLESAGFEHVYLDGGAVIREGLREGLVDEITLSYVPIILGKGIPLFTSDLPRSLWQLKSSRNFPSGLMQTVYEIKQE